jgi:hypothetical protein
MVEMHNACFVLTKIVVDRLAWIIYDRGKGGIEYKFVYSFEISIDELAFSMYDRGRGGSVFLFFY